MNPRRLWPVAALSILFVMQATARAADRDWAALLKGLASADFPQREATQRELEKIPADEMETLLDLADRQVDPEVRSRLQLRISGMALERLTGQANAKPSTRAHITGRIVDDDGKGVPNLPMKATTWSMGREFARGVLLDDFLRGFRAESSTDAEGHFDIGVPFADILYSISAKPDGAGPRKMNVPDSGPIGELTLSSTGLQRQIFRGVVYDDLLKPLANQEVELYGRYGLLGRTTTNHLGQYSVELIASQAESWLPVVRAGDFASPIQGPLSGNDAGALRVVKGASIEGTVREGDLGKGIAHARVTLNNNRIGFRMVTQTDVDGHYRFTGLPPMPLVRSLYGVYAEVPGFVNRPTSPTSARTQQGSTATLDVTMERAAVIIGTVLDSGGRAVAGALVGVDSRGLAGSLDEWRYVETDAQGRYVIAAGHPGERIVLAAYSSTNGLAGIELEPLAPAQILRRNLTLPGATRLRGFVTDEQGRPVKGVTCRLGEMKYGMAGEFVVTTGQDGRFDLGQASLVPGESLHLTFTPPRFFVKNASTYGVRGEGAALLDYSSQPSDFKSRETAPTFFQNQEIPLNAAPGQTVDLKVKLEPAQMLEFTGILLDAHGNPVPGADVLLLIGDATPDGWLTNLTLIDRQGKRLTAGPPNIISGASQTGPDGRWTILAIQENGIGTPPRPQKVDGSRFSIGAYTGGREALIRAMSGDYSGINDTLLQNIEIPKDSGKVELTLRLK